MITDDRTARTLALLAEIEHGLEEMELRVKGTRKCLGYIREKPDDRAWWRSLVLAVDNIGHAADDLEYTLCPPWKRDRRDAR
jgi:hypothetical protein